MEWRGEEIYKIINLYRQFECLWDFKSPTYKRTDQKNNAWQEIGRELKKDVSEVKKKMKHLRTAYLAEKKKVDCSKKSGFSMECIYESHLYYFSEMSFLDAVVVLRRTTSSINAESVECEAEACNIVPSLTESSATSIHVAPLPSLSPPVVLTPLPSPSPESSSQASSSSSSKFSNRKSRRDAKFNSAVDAIIASATAVETDDVFISFGKTIALQLKQLPLAEATRTMSEVHSHVLGRVLAHMDEPEPAIIQPNFEEPDILHAALYDANII